MVFSRRSNNIGEANSFAMSTVFISYNHDSEEHKSRVRRLADSLRNDGVTSLWIMDCGSGGPGEGWEKWSEHQAGESHIVLAVFTESYRRCWDGSQVSGMRTGRHLGSASAQSADL